MQRGFMITLVASENSARDRACGSVMPVNADGGRSSFVFCACGVSAGTQNRVAPTAAAQIGTARMDGPPQIEMSLVLQLTKLKKVSTCIGRPKTDIYNIDASKHNRPIVGVQILMGLRPQGANKWSG
jgi:hypothetical protein